MCTIIVGQSWDKLGTSLEQTWNKLGPIVEQSWNNIGTHYYSSGHTKRGTSQTRVVKTWGSGLNWAYNKGLIVYSWTNISHQHDQVVNGFRK